MMRSAPRCRTGESGATSRMPPSPYHSSAIRTAGKKMGMAAEAITCSTDRTVWTEMRLGRSHSSIPLPWTNVTERPVV